MEAAEKILNPETYSYNCSFNGREINPVLLNKRWKEYVQQLQIEQLLQACRATNSVAISAGLMSRQEKEKNREKRYAAGRKVYYLFQEDGIPLSIYCRLKPEEGKLIYD